MEFYLRLLFLVSILKLMEVYFLLEITYSKSTTETLGHGLKYDQSYLIIYNFLTHFMGHILNNPVSRKPKFSKGFGEQGFLQSLSWCGAKMSSKRAIG